MRIKLLLFLFFAFSFSWSQTTFAPTSTTAGTFKVPAGVTSLSVECWGAGGAGGGVTPGASLFAGGGGGGGAYSKVASLSVTPAVVLNYKVGAGGTGSNGANGTDGEQTYFASVSANGGVGGKFGNPSLGAGGAGGAASGSGIKFSGGNGATAAILNLVTINSGGGGGGAGTLANGGDAINATAGAGGTSGGGAGGTGVIALFSDGANGAVPGGGGSGAASLITVGVGKKGGSGGNGQLKVIYTCPVYGLTSATTADDVCVSVGSTSQVKLTGGGSLPDGDYTVTYNRSNPNATGLTASMSVTGGTGIGFFTVEGLSAVGSSTITITNLASESCTSAINTFNTVTINVYANSVGGSISPVSPICSGSTSGTMTLSGNTGSVVKWQSAVSPFMTWTDIPTATSSTYTSGVLTETTHFRVVVKNGPCSEINSGTITVIVRTSPSITTSGTLSSICYSTTSQSTSLSYTAPTNNPTSYSLTWSAAAITAGLSNIGVTTFTFSSGGGNLAITIPAGIAANTYSGTLTIFNANCSATQAVQLTINPKPDSPIPNSITQPTCATTTGSVVLTGLPNSTPSNGNITIVQTGAALANYSIAPTSSYTVTGLAPGTYNFTVQYTGSCVSSLSANVVINNLTTNTYNAGGWSGGTPTINQNLIFNSNFTSAGAGAGDINGCSCTINSGIVVIMKQEDTMTISNAVVNNGGTLTFENHASLVQLTNASNSGNINYKRNASPMKNFDFTYWSSPVSAQILYNLSPNTLSDKFFSFTGTAWKQENALTTIMQPGKGYIIRTPKEGNWPNGESVTFPYAQPVEFIGIPNNGNITGESVVAGNYYLVGNPYPSALNLDTFLFSNPIPNNSGVLGGTIYLWTHNTSIKKEDSQYVYSSADYATYNGVGGVATQAAYLGGEVPSGKVAAGQSFFVLANNNGTIAFNNAMRISANNKQFFKPAKINLLERHRIWLNMTNTQGAFKQLLVGYVEGASNELDRDFDGISFDGNSFIDFYSINLGSNLAIQGRALPFLETDTVPLGYRTVIAGNFTISIDKTDGVLSGQSVYVEDKLTNTIHDLNQSDYTFTTATGVFNNRFVLRYSNNTLGIDNFKTKDNSVSVWIENKSIKIHTEEENIKEIFIYDITGKLVYKNNAVSKKDEVIANHKFKNEVLIVRVVLENDQAEIKKIAIVNK